MDNRVLVMASTTGLATVLFFLAFDPEVYGYDDGIVLTGAARVLRGSVPYRDFWSMYGPATFYFNAGLMSLFGEYAIVPKVVGIISKLGIVAISTWIISNYHKWPSAMLGGLTVASVLTGVGFDLFPVFQSLLLIMVAIALVTQSRNVALGAFVAGVCLGLAALFRHDLGAYSLISLVLYFLFRLFAKHERFPSKSSVISCFIFFGVGCALVFLPPAGILILVAGWETLFHDLFYFPAVVYPEVRRLPWPTTLTWDLVVYLPALTPILPFIRSTDDMRGKRHIDSDGLFYLLCLTALLFILKGSVRTSPIHLAPALVLFLTCLFVAVPVSALARPFRISTAIAVPFVLFLAAWIAQHAFRPALGTISDFLQRGQTELTNACSKPVHPKLLCLAFPERYAAALDTLNLLEPGDGIYVGVADHRDIHLNFQAFYFVAGNFSPSRLEELHPGLQDQKNVQLQMIRDFDAAPPKLIYLDTAFSGVMEPNQSRFNTPHTDLDDFIRSNYRIIDSFESVSVLGLADG